MSTFYLTHASTSVVRQGTPNMDSARRRSFVVSSLIALSIFFVNAFYIVFILEISVGSG